MERDGAERRETGAAHTDFESMAEMESDEIFLVCLVHLQCADDQK
jgi:hypothetical protein